MKIITNITIQIIQSLLLIAIAPLLVGWINQIRANLNNKTGPGILQPYRLYHKLFLKESVLADNASPIFCYTPIIYFSAMCLLTAIIPVLSTHLAFAPVADVIALVGLFTLSRIFLALAGMDIGTAFGYLGARREMLVSFLAEPVLLMIFFNFAFMHESTALATIVNTSLTAPLTLQPSLSFAAMAFAMVLLAENGRLPIDNASTHLELTMIHEALVLEYSGRNLALIEWANSLKLVNYCALGCALFFPWGISLVPNIASIATAGGLFIAKLFFLGLGLAIFECLTSKVRLFRAAEFLTVAFLLAILSVLTQLLVVR